MQGLIRLEMGDWLYNAGLVGMINILKYSGDSLEIKEQYVEFDRNLLEDFQNKYFKYLIDKYEKILSWHKVISYEDTIHYHENNDLEYFGKDELDNLNRYIKDIAKYYLNSASYKAAYPFIDEDIKILSLIKEIKTIKLKKQEKIEEKLEEVQKVFIQLKTIINYCKGPKSKQYLAGKNVIYTIIKNAWDGVCFLNPQTKEKDIYVDYSNYFGTPAMEYINADKTKYKYNCFICNKTMKDLKNDLSFLNNIGFDVSRKSSHVWDFNNDIAICPVCKLVYSCIPAGMTYVYDQGIYINQNISLYEAVNINERIKTEILKGNEFNKNLTYKVLVNAISEQKNNSTKYDLVDIQVVKYKAGHYSFNILSRKMLQTINESKADLNRIVSCGFKEGNVNFYIYELVIDRILNNQNLFTLMHKLLIYKLSRPKDCRFNLQQLTKILIINLRIMEGMGYMEKPEKDIIKLANASGYYLREGYKSKGAKDKLNGISYRLLNSLKTNNKNMFMDTLLNCYLYVQKTVPSIFLDALKDDEQYKIIGYAFVTGLIEGKENITKNRGNE